MNGVEAVPSRNWAWAPLLVLLLGLLATGAGAWHLHRVARARDEARLAEAAERTRDAIARRIDTYVALLRATAGLFATGHPVTEPDFKAYVDRINLASNYPGTLGLGFSARVPRDALPALLETIRTESRNPDFRSWFLPGGTPDPDEAHVVVYLQPLTWRNRRALGLDMFSEPQRRTAMERARDGAGPAATAALALVQETQTDRQWGVNIYLPVYRDGEPPDSVQERRELLRGFVYTPVRVGDLISGVFPRRAPTDFVIYDGDAAAPGAEIERWDRGVPGPDEPGLSTTGRLRFAGRTWTLASTPAPGFHAESEDRLVPYILGSGLILSLVLFLTTLSLARSAVQLRRSRDALRQSEEQFRTSFALAAAGQMQSDATTGRFLRVNAKFCEMLGYAPEELLGRTFMDVTHPDDRDASEREFARMVSGTIAEAALDKRYLRKDGSVMWAHVSAAVVRDDAGRALRTVTVVEDITQRRADLEELRRSEGLLKAVVETAADAIITIDAGGAILTFNPAAERIFGYSAAEAVGREISLLMPEPHRSRCHEYLSAFARTGERKIIGGGREVRGRRKNGEEFPMELAVSETSLGSDGRRMFTGIVRDISERRAAERALRDTEARFRLMADAAPVLVWIGDADRRTSWLNQGWVTFTGSTLEEELARGRERAVHPADLERWRTTVSQAWERHEPFTLEYRLRRRDGQWRWVMDRGVPLYGPNREFAGFIGSAFDITDRKRAEEEIERTARELRAQATELARSNADLADFAHVAAHDLKEPLRGIRQTVSFLLEDYSPMLGDPGRERLDRLDRLAKRMHDLLDALLEFGQVGRGELNLRECDLNVVAHEVKAALTPVLERQHAALTIRPLPRVRCDRVLTGQVLTNLISNAIKYNDSEEKRVEVGTEWRDGLPAIYVKDNGIGIDPSHEATVFRMFKRLHTRDRYGGGAGAGLAIAKRIVERHGGRIWFRSAVGHGTTFYFTLAPGGPSPRSERPVPDRAAERAASDDSSARAAEQRQHAT